MSQVITVKSTGLTVDLILFRAYGVAGRSLIEQTLADNPGLADLGPMLPVGTAITIPDRPQAKATVRKRVSLFG